jgi:hypothetical protein
MTARNNNQNPNQFQYDAFMKIQLQDRDLYYHFYIINDRRIDVKKPRNYVNIIRPENYQPIVRIYVRPGLTDHQWDMLHGKCFERIYNLHNIDPDEVTYIYWNDETNEYETDD